MLMTTVRASALSKIVSVSDIDPLERRKSNV